MAVRIGDRMKRKEDPRLITGSATYTDDIKLAGMVHVAFVRSPHAHARIVSVNLEPARMVPGFVAAFSGADLRDAWKIPLPCAWAGQPGLKNPAHWPVAVDAVRYVGDPVAVVVAADRYAARDVADLVQVEYEPLPTAVDLEAAMRPGAPKVHPDLPDNICFTWTAANGDVDGAFRDAEVTVKQRYYQQRMVPTAIEARAVVADYRRASGELTVWSSTQIPHFLKLFTSLATGVPEHLVRVIAPEVGGAFGSKLQVYGEEFTCAALAMKLGRPVKWNADRREAFVADHHGRACITDIEVVAKRDGTITGTRVKWIQNNGAYNMLDTPYIPILGVLVSPGPYRNRTFSIEITGVFTNTTPTDAYRGAGRPEVVYYWERTMDLLARECNLDPVEVRRRNLVRKEEFPWTSAVGIIYDTGDYITALEKAADAIGYKGLRREQEQRRRSGDGRLLGVGFSSYVEACGLAPSKAVAATNYGAALAESAMVRVHHTGKVTVYTGSSAHGQGHETAWAQIVADRLGISPDDVDVLHGDTGRGPLGFGTMGSRSLVVGGVALYQALEKIREKARQIGAHLLEAKLEDVVYEGAGVQVRGVPGKTVGFGQIAAVANLGAFRLPDDIEPGLEVTTFFSPANFSFPFGTHACAVEVDPEDGKVKIRRYICVDDAGVIVNPLLAEGQIHGGVAQGVSQALYEELVYDENGQPLGASLMEYVVPKAAQIPRMETQFTVTPAATNPMGVKGIGEAGTIGSTPAVVNAVVDALSPLGIRDLDMPLTPYRVYQAIQQAKAAKGGAR